MDTEAEQSEKQKQQQQHSQGNPESNARSQMEPLEAPAEFANDAANSSESEELSEDDGDFDDYDAIVDGWRPLMGDDVKVKNVNCPHPESETAAVQSDVCCSFAVAVLNESGEPGEVVRSLENVIYRIGAGDTIPALELGLRYSKLGDEFVLRSTHKFAYGSKGLLLHNVQVVPPDADIELHVTVHSIAESISPAEMTVEQLENELTLRKLAGNRLLAEDEPQRALRCYGQSLKMLEGSELDMTLPEMTPVRQLILDILNNTAMVHLQMKEYRKAKDACISVLEIDPGNVKALFRAGKAAIYTADYDEAEAALQRALELAPNDAKIMAGYRELKQREKAYHQDSKQMFQSMSHHLFKGEKQQGDAVQQTTQSGLSREATATKATSKFADVEPVQQQQAAQRDASNLEIETLDRQEVARSQTTTAATRSEPQHQQPIKAKQQAQTAKRSAYSWVIPAVLGVIIAIIVMVLQQQ